MRSLIANYRGCHVTAAKLQPAPFRRTGGEIGGADGALQHVAVHGGDNIVLTSVEDESIRVVIEPHSRSYR